MIYLLAQCFFFLPPGRTDYDPCGISNPAFWSACEVPKNASSMILSSLDPAPSGAHPRGRILPWSLAIVLSVFVAIWLGQHQTGPAAADFCSNFVFNYPRSISEPLGAPACPDKNCWAEEIFGAIWLGLLPTGPAAAVFCPNTAFFNSWWTFKPQPAPLAENWAKFWQKNLQQESVVESAQNAAPPAAPQVFHYDIHYMSFSKPISEPLGALSSPDKFFLVLFLVTAFLGAICPDRQPTGLTAADFCIKTVLDLPISFIGSLIWEWLLCCSHNNGIKQESNPAAGDNKDQPNPPNPPVTPSEETQTDIPI